MPGYPAHAWSRPHLILSLLITVLGTSVMLPGLQLVSAQTPAPSEPKPPKPKNRTGTRKLESTITAIDKDGQPPRITLKDGVLSVMVKPTTALVQEERGLIASDLKLDDKLSLISFKSKGNIRSNAVVTSLTPLVLSIDGLATLTITHVENVSFSRYTPLHPEALAVGQTVALEMKLLTDGEIEATRIAVVIEKVKPPKPAKENAPKSRRPKVPTTGGKPTVVPTRHRPPDGQILNPFT